MKKTIILAAIILQTITAIAQGGFSAIEITASNTFPQIRFTASKEVNVRYYLVEGSNDNEEFEVVSRVPSLGNSVMSRTYKVDLAALDYKYYRVRQVDMSSAYVTSPAVVNGDSEAGQQVATR